MARPLRNFFLRKFDSTLTYFLTTFFFRMKLQLCTWLAWITFKPKILPHCVTFCQRPEPRLMLLTLMAILHYIFVASTAYQIRPKYWYVRHSPFPDTYSDTSMYFSRRWITVLISKKGPASDTRPFTFAPTTIEWEWPAFC